MPGQGRPLLPTSPYSWAPPAQGLPSANQGPSRASCSCLQVEASREESLPAACKGAPCLHLPQETKGPHG